ncbi:hypothetical protein ACH47V_25525 [Micromonospora chersina]|uniref:hypothetical protein n=1 Tax=Micromonospora chersina TaxID=47854 RepID=UPI003407CD03
MALDGELIVWQRGRANFALLQRREPPAQRDVPCAMATNVGRVDTGITHAGEGTNRLIKTVVRNAYGFRNPVQPTAPNLAAPQPDEPEAPRPPLTSLSPYPREESMSDESDSGVWELYG